MHDLSVFLFFLPNWIYRVFLNSYGFSHRAMRISVCTWHSVSVFFSSFRMTSFPRPTVVAKRLRKRRKYVREVNELNKCSQLKKNENGCWKCPMRMSGPGWTFSWIEQMTQGHTQGPTFRNGGPGQNHYSGALSHPTAHKDRN